MGVFTFLVTQYIGGKVMEVMNKNDTEMSCETTQKLIGNVIKRCDQQTCRGNILNICDMVLDEYCLECPYIDPFIKICSK